MKKPVKEEKAVAVCSTWNDDSYSLDSFVFSNWLAGSDLDKAKYSHQVKSFVFLFYWTFVMVEMCIGWILNITLIGSED